MVVLPEPVPPEMMRLSLAVTAPFNRSIMPCVMDFFATRSSGISLSVPKRRIDSNGPSTASGGIIALTREPSESLASTMGEDSSTRRPTCETILSIIRYRWLSSLKVTLVSSSWPFRSMYTCLWVLTKMSLIVVSSSRGSSGPRPNTSSRTSSQICCLSSELRRVDSSSINDIKALRTSTRTLSLSMLARASRLILSRSRRCSRNLSSWYSGFRVSRLRAPPRLSRSSQVRSSDLCMSVVNDIPAP